MTPHRRQGAVLIAGGALIFLLVEVGDLRFYWTPLLVGLAYLAAAGSAGRRGSYWATALVITGWGLGVLLIGEAVVESVTPQAGYLLAAGTGALAAALLERRGYAIDALGIAGAVFAAGLIFALEPQAEALGYARTYAAAIAVIGLIRLAGPQRGRGSAR